MTSTYSSVRYGSLNGRSVLITGGASGLGAAMVEAYVEQGARVAFLDIDVASGTALAARTGARFLECNLLDIDALRRSVKEIESVQDGIGVLVNNAGKDDRQAFDTIEPGD